MAESAHKRKLEVVFHKTQLHIDVIFKYSWLYLAAYLSEIQRQVADNWHAGAFALPEFPFPEKRPYVSEHGATLSADFKLGRVFKGKLVPLEESLERFKYHPAFKDEVETLLQELAAQKAQQPCWNQDEGVAEEPMGGDGWIR